MNADALGEVALRLYRLTPPPNAVRTILLQYVAEANALAEAPAFYNTITTNCTTAVVKLVRAAGGALPFDWPLILNGHLPGYLYDHGAVVTTMPLQELIERARIEDQASAADQSPDFSKLIRVGSHRRAPRPRRHSDEAGACCGSPILSGQCLCGRAHDPADDRLRS